MKKSLPIIIAVVAFFCVGCGDNSTGSGEGGGGKPTPAKTKFTDDRDGTTYNKVTIGSQVWMAENLNYDVPDDTTDICYYNSSDSCAKYGRLYDWETAKAACPAGWHLPTDVEWQTLIDYVGGREIAGKKLKSTSGWNDYKGKSGNGTDNYGFKALPGGMGGSGSNFYRAGYGGFWWSAAENAVSYAYSRSMSYDYEGELRGNYDERGLFSVRCVEE